MADRWIRRYRCTPLRVRESTTFRKEKLAVENLFEESLFILSRTLQCLTQLEAQKILFL